MVRKENKEQYEVDLKEYIICGPFSMEIVDISYQLEFVEGYKSTVHDIEKGVPLCKWNDHFAERNQELEFF